MNLGGSGGQIDDCHKGFHQAAIHHDALSVKTMFDQIERSGEGKDGCVVSAM